MPCVLSRHESNSLGTKGPSPSKRPAAEGGHPQQQPQQQQGQGGALDAGAVAAALAVASTIAGAAWAAAKAAGGPGHNNTSAGAGAGAAAGGGEADPINEFNERTQGRGGNGGSKPSGAVHKPTALAGSAPQPLSELGLNKVAGGQLPAMATKGALCWLCYAGRIYFRQRPRMRMLMFANAFTMQMLLNATRI